ncbi:hypothetical protein N9F47_02940 [Gammaproteobacteria bacterium]|nr:hypothetical protein [Gammaproteobacteria bacterium]
MSVTQDSKPPKKALLDLTMDEKKSSDFIILDSNRLTFPKNDVSLAFWN